MKKKAIALIDYIDDDGMIAFQVNQRVNIIEFTDNCLVKTKYGYIKISKEYLKNIIKCLKNLFQLKFEELEKS